MINAILTKIIGTKNEREIKRIRPIIERIGSLEAEVLPLSDAQLQAGNPARIFGLSFVLALVGAFVFAMFLGPKPAFPMAATAGVLAGVAWVGTSFGINYLFEHKSLKLFLVLSLIHI